jgi:hypothetical protein
MSSSRGLFLLISFLLAPAFVRADCLESTKRGQPLKPSQWAREEKDCRLAVLSGKERRLTPEMAQLVRVTAKLGRLPALDAEWARRLDGAGSSAGDQIGPLGVLTLSEFEQGHFTRARDLISRFMAAERRAPPSDLNGADDDASAFAAFLSFAVGDQSSGLRHWKDAGDVPQMEKIVLSPFFDIWWGADCGWERLSKGSARAAVDYFRRTERGAEQELGPRHPILAPLLNGLADSLDRLGDRAEAATARSRASQILQSPTSR